MKNNPPEQVMDWLQSQPSAEELAGEFPELRESIRLEMAHIVADGSSLRLSAYLKRTLQAERFLEQKYRGNSRDRKVATALAQQKVRTRMAHLAVKQHLVSEATGIEKGKVRFNLFNGYVAQKLLFANDLERKPVSLFLFRLVWPLLPQRKLLMPLVQPKGIYCFYSRQLIVELSALIGKLTCLEIAAGDGTLTRFLIEAGVRVTATDDQSWKHEVSYPEFVIKRDAQEAVREFSPEVVICSWPPAGNTFERQVFRTRSVQRYIVIGSRHRLAAGNWTDYLQQTAFEYTLDERLSGLVLPPELDAAVYVFRRKRGE